jgi:uncharacterized membrane protein
VGVAIALLCGFGILLALVSASCVAHDLPDEDTKLFGRVPWALIGAVGYAVILVTLMYPTVTKVLAVGAGLTTVWLIRKGVEVKIGCPFCFTVWGVNLLILVLAFLR